MNTEMADLNIQSEKFAEQVIANQNKLRSELRSHYDFIVCGSGSSGSVVAGRLAQNPDLHVLLLEAGGNDDAASVMEASRWITNIGSERYWQFKAEHNPWLNGRAISLGMGKALGGGSSINAMIWARGHKSDWDFFASEAGDPTWNYESVLNIYRRIEDWRGAPDPKYRGTGGPVFVQPGPDLSPVARALFKGIRSVGIPIFENQNGRMMEADGGASVPDMRIRDGKRQSLFRSYVFPYMDRQNLTVIRHALVTRLTFEDKRVTGVEIFWHGRTHRIRAGREVIISLGAINTPKLLMQSGIGDQTELRRFGIPVVQHLPGVGHGFQDHPAVACVWECAEPLPRDVVPDVVLFWKSDNGLASPDFQILQAVFDAQDAAKLGLPASGWTLFGNVVQPKSRGQIRVTGPDADDPVQIEANLLSDSDDRKALLACAKLCRAIGNFDVLRPFLKREILPGKLKRTTLEDYIRNGAVSFWHQTSTAKMGRDVMSVVDGNLKVYGIDNLRIADASIMPRVTTGNTMAPCVVIGERAAEIIQNQHQIEASVFPIHGKKQNSSQQRRQKGHVKHTNKANGATFAFVTKRMSQPDLGSNTNVRTMDMKNNNTKNSTVLVVGATGVLGVEVCRQLAAAGKKVKGLVRTSSQKVKVDALHKLGVETVTGDMKDPHSLYQAFQNVDAIISTATSTISHGEGDSIETVDLAGQLNVAEAASAAGVQHVVFISFPPYPSMTPEFPLQSAKRSVEHKLKSKSFTYTILQPTYFMEIWLGPALGFDCAHAKAVIYGEGRNKISWIAIKDVASFAVASIDNPAAKNAVVQLGGPDDLSVMDAVGIFEQESGQTFELQNVPDEALRAQMAAPDSLGKTFGGLMIGLNEARTIDMKKTLRNFPIQLTSVRKYARQVIAAEAAADIDPREPIIQSRPAHRGFVDPDRH